MDVTRHYFKSREEFLAIRDKFHAEHRLGGSDIGTAAGKNKWKSRRRLYEEMTGGITPPDISNKQSIIDGILCEDLVAKKFEERSGKKVHRENCVMTSDAAPHLFASIDRKVENEDAGLECKTANAFNWEAFKDGKLPDSYVKQIKTYLKVTGLKRWYVYVWIMGIAEYCYVFTRDGAELDTPPVWADAIYFVSEMELDEVEEIAADFCRLVAQKTPPECDGSDDESDILKEMHPASVEGKVAEILSVSEEDLGDLAARKLEIKAHEEAIAAIENRIKDALGDAAEGTIGKYKITWKNNKSSMKTDWKAAGAELSADIIAKYTKEVPGARVLRIGKAK